MSNSAKIFARISMIALLGVILICSFLLIDLNGYFIGNIASAESANAASSSAYTLPDNGICRPNLLYNSDFKKNSKGKETYTNIDKMTVDNWYLSGSSTLEIKSDFVRFSSSQAWSEYRTYINKPSDLVGKALTLTVYAKFDKPISLSLSLYRDSSRIAFFDKVFVSGADFTICSLSVTLWDDIKAGDEFVFHILNANEIGNNVIDIKYAKAELGDSFSGWCPSVKDNNSSDFSSLYVTPKGLSADKYYLNLSAIPAVPADLPFDKFFNNKDFFEFFRVMNDDGTSVSQNAALGLAWQRSIVRDPVSSSIVGYDFRFITGGESASRTSDNVLFWGYVSVSSYKFQFTNGLGIFVWDDCAWNVSPTLTVDGLKVFASASVTPRNYINDKNSSLSYQFGSFGWSDYLALFDVKNWEVSKFGATYDAGYAAGLEVGKGYASDKAYLDGYNRGYIVGKNDGMSLSALADKYSFLNLIGAVIDAPIQALFGGREVRLASGTKVKLSDGSFYILTNDAVARTTGLFNFSLLGVDMSALVLSLFTLAIVFTVLKLVLNKN